MRSINGKTYKMGPKLGEGSYGVVYSVYRNDDTVWAFKKYDYESSAVGTLREISMLKLFQGNEQGVINLEDIIHTENNFGLIMPKYKLCLYQAIYHDLLDDGQRWNICHRLLNTLVFLKENGVIHRDIKSDNILLDKEYNPILIDFSLAKIFTGPSQDGTHTPTVFTPAYRPPEVRLLQNYSFPADAWALGIVFYEIYINLFKFAISDEVMYRRIGKLTNNLVRQLLTGLLQRDPKVRWTPQYALSTSNLPKIYESVIMVYPKDSFSISAEIADLCDKLNVEKIITRGAAHIYMEKTNCNVYDAVNMASKFYELDVNIDSINLQLPELELLTQMNYNLFV